MLDVGLAWDAKTTLQRARLFKPYRLFWIEEPLSPDDYSGYAKVSRGCLQPIAAGEQECSVVGFERLIDEGGVDIAQIDLTRCGFTQAMRIGAAIAGDARSRPPTPAMKRFADSIAREKGVKPPPGCATSGSICRAFLNQHAPKKADAGIPGASGSKPASPAQMVFAEKLAQEKGIAIPDEAKASSAAMSTWIDFNQVKKRDKSCRKRVNSQRNQSLLNPRFKERDLETRGKCRCHGYSVNAGSGEFGNRYPTADSLRQQGCRPETWRRYRAGGWYAPAGVDLAAFGERGWL